MGCQKCPGNSTINRKKLLEIVLKSVGVTTAFYFVTYTTKTPVLATVFLSTAVVNGIVTNPYLRSGIIGGLAYIAAMDVESTRSVGAAIAAASSDTVLNSVSILDLFM